ncbi:MAG: Ppx/GppA family phosphatase [Sphingopyxis sp.]
MARLTGMADARRVGIIDIGSNSVRLVVYAGPARTPQAIFNEKLMVGLGANLATSGRIEEPGYSRAIEGLVRFKALVCAMNITDVRCVATAAVRDASNGADFIRDAKAVGHDIQTLSGRDEARAAGHGVISAFPDADGIVADLGGGSLELVRVQGGTTAHHSSFPFGVLRLDALAHAHGKGFAKHIRRAVAAAGWRGEDAGLPLYLVGGSWRALARYDMLLTRDAMPIVSGHSMAPGAAQNLHRRLRQLGPGELDRLKGLSSARVGTIPAAASLLVPLVAQLQSSELIVSASGLREGLLFQDLPSDVRALDPLLVAAEVEGRRFARFAPIGAAINDWIAPLFQGDAPADSRLRLAACHLCEAAVSANPDFRAERAAEMALHGAWLGIDMAGRQVLAQALSVSAGGAGRQFSDASLDTRMTRAWQWGLAMRLALRLSGGAAGVFADSILSRDDHELTLTFGSASAAMMGEQVRRRLHQLASGLGLSARVKVN